MSESEQTKWVGSDAIAEMFGLSARRIQQLTKEGVLVCIREGHTNQYELIPTVRRYFKYTEEKFEAETLAQDGGAERKKIEAETKYKESKAGMAALQLKEWEGKMHRSEDVEAMTTDLVYAVRGMLLALPGRLAIDLAAMSQPAEVSHHIRDEAYKILENLSEYRYDPERYAQRVRDRQGWDVIEDDGS